MAQLEEACTICGLGTPFCLCDDEISDVSPLPEGVLATDNEADAQGLLLGLHAFGFDPFSAAQGLPQDCGTGCSHGSFATRPLSMQGVFRNHCTFAQKLT